MDKPVLSQHRRRSSQPPLQSTLIANEIKLTAHKNKFAFPRATRLLSQLQKPLLNHEISYCTKSDFDRYPKKDGSPATFGGTGHRFNYYSTQGKQGMMPSPHNYNTVNLVTVKGKGPVGYGDSRMSAFGFGRERMQKLHIDAILYKNIRGDDQTNPGPGTHDVSMAWVTPVDSSLSKTTPQYSFSKSRKDSQEHFNMQIHKKRDLPGPGMYSTPLDVPILQQSKRYNRTGYGRRGTTHTLATAEDSLYGPSIQQQSPRNHHQGNSSICSNTAMSKVGASLSSMLRSDVGKSFARAKDRFQAPTLRQTNPSPNLYQIPDTVGLDMTKHKQRVFNARNLGKTVFGREDRSRQFDKLILPLEKIEAPGPGQYAHYTLFNNDAKHMRSSLVSRSVLNNPSMPNTPSPQKKRMSVDLPEKREE